LNHEFLHHLRDSNVGIKLLRADLMPFIASFFWNTFTAAHRRQLDEEDIIARLEDHMFAMTPSGVATRPARDYLRSWVEAGYLRQYYVPTDDIPRYELVADVDKAIDWLFNFKNRTFVGTESRLKTIFDVLSQLMEESESDREKRLAILFAERQKIDEEIARVQAGDIQILSPTQVRERFAQIEDLARQLLRDFSEVEQNFRDLDRGVREKIAHLEGSRGDVLAVIFSDADAINDSEQGKSFTSFFEFLMSAERLQTWEDMLKRLYGLEAIRELEPNPFVGRLKLTLLEASDKVMETRSRLANQLRRFLDDRSRLEDRRINDLVRSIERKLLDLRDRLTDTDVTTQLVETRLRVYTPTRNLFRIPLKIRGQDDLVKADGETVSMEALFAQDFVDERILFKNIRRCLDENSPVALGDVVKRFPIEKGVAELVAYLKIASRDARAAVLDDQDVILLNQGERNRAVTMPRILFSR
jgi:hypothetical protein